MSLKKIPQGHPLYSYLLITKTILDLCNFSWRNVVKLKIEMFVPSLIKSLEPG